MTDLPRVLIRALIRPSRALAAAVLCTSPLLGSAGAQRAAPSAQDVAEVKAKYLKREVRIPMRDGAQLFTSIYVPRDTSRPYPIMMSRTPYGVAPYGDTAFKASLGPSKRFQDEGFIFVYQDTRGRYMSDGTYAFMTPYIDKKTGPKDVDESSDTYDTIEWLLKNVTPNNGRVGTWGISAPGYGTPIPMVPNEPTTVEFALQDVFHTLQPGHRLMVQVQSTWFPLIDRNPQTFVPNIYKAKESDFRAATMRVYHSKTQPSSITFGVLPSGGAVVP